ncbi:MAG: HIRAN domain-containing protein, partial [Gemmatimonadales bacterium]
MRNLALVLTFLFLIPQTVSGQSVPAVEPGAVVTVTIDPPATLSANRDSLGRLILAYATEVAGEVRMIGGKSGSFTWERGEKPRFPVTLRVPERAQAGETQLALVAFETEDGRVGSVPVRVRVRAVRRVEVQLVGASEAAGRGEAVSFSYMLTNMGNAGDSVALSIETNLGEHLGVIPAAIWLAPFEEKSGRFDISVPTDAVVGSEVYVRLSAVLEGNSVTAHSTVAVLPEKGLFPDLVQIPSTVFLGSTVTASEGTASTQPVVAATGSGKLGQDTELLYNYRY